MNERYDASTFHRTGDAIITTLERRGFVAIEQRESATHVLLRRDHIDIVVPAADRRVPEKVVQMIERSLESALGPNWLSVVQVESEQSAIDEILVLDVVVLEPAEDDLWRSFLVDDLSTIGCGETRRGALADLKAAASLRTGVSPEQIVLVTPDVI